MTLSGSVSIGKGGGTRVCGRCYHCLCAILFDALPGRILEACSVLQWPNGLRFSDPANLFSPWGHFPSLN